MTNDNHTTASEIVAQLRRLAKENYKRILLRHGVREPVLGVSVAELKQIQKRVKKDYRLAIELYDTGIYDAMYLAGLVADDKQMTKKDLQRWVDHAHAGALCSSTVAWVAAESPHGWDLARKWIDSKKEQVAAAGWTTLTSLVSIRDDADLDLPALKQLLQRVQKTIHHEPDGVRYAMNGFVIALGAYVKSLTALALQTAEKIGTVDVDMGETACQVPYAPDYLRKIMARGTVGKKRKAARC